MKIVQIRVTYHAKIPLTHQAEAERALKFHQNKCPAYQSVNDSSEIKIDADIEYEA